MGKEYKPATLSAMAERQKAYALVFGDEKRAGSTLMVLDDLSRFCREKSSCFHIDPRAHAALEGRREVILRIRDHLELSVPELCNKYGGE